ncbi:MAG: COX15/CtaA family protein [Pseudomonadota bacterium]
MALQVNSDAARQWIRAWLLIVGLTVYAMILIGGATRLTDSGLSITEWDPIKGALPPLSADAWTVLFDKYKETTEYQRQNSGMSLGEFKYIFWWEWGHRLFGRLIGLVAVGGYAVFAFRGWLSKALSRRLLLLIVLGGFQGFVGWWMVASGIGETTRIDVAPYRLMTHFCMALLIIALTAWTWLDLGAGPQKSAGTDNAHRYPLMARWASIAILVLVAAQLASGALVAGLDAGRSYNDWPLMAGEVFPSNYVQHDLGVRSLFEGQAATQFNHRFLAYVLWGLSLFAWFKMRSWPWEANFGLVAGLISLQAIWGIITLLSTAPLGLALVHQGLGVVILLAAVRLVWQVHRGASRQTNTVSDVRAVAAE